MQDEINYLAEFKEEDKEKEFHDNEVRKGLKLSRNIIVIFAVVNFLFVLIDYGYLQYADRSVIIYHSLTPRTIVLTCGIFVWILLKRAENKSGAINSVIAFAVLAYLLHEYTAMHFAPVDLVFEVLDLVILTYGLFMVPNRWIVNLCTVVFLNVVFFVLTPFTIPTMSIATKGVLFIEGTEKVPHKNQSLKSLKMQ